MFAKSLIIAASMATQQLVWASYELAIFSDTDLTNAGSRFLNDDEEVPVRKLKCFEKAM